MKLVKNATGVIEIRNSSTNELEKFFDPTGMIVTDHPRVSDCVCISKTPNDQDESESISIKVTDVSHIAGVEYTGTTRAAFKEALVLLFKRGGGSGEGLQGGSTPQITQASVWTRPTEWLAIPSYGVNEEVIYLLNAVWDTTVNPCAFTLNGTGAGYTVDWGDGTTSNHAMNTKAQKNYVYSSLSGTSFRGYRQALIKITPQAGAVINWMRFMQHNSYAYTYHSGFLEIVCNLNSQTSLAPFTANSAVINSNVECVFYKAHTPNDLQYLFADFSSLKKINVFNTSHVTTMEYAFFNCGISEVPEYDFSNVLNANSAFMATFSLQKVKSSDFKKVTNASSMFRDSYISDLSNIQFRDITGMYLFNYTAGKLIRFPDFSLCNSISGNLDYSLYTLSIDVYPYLNVAGVTTLGNIFYGMSSRVLRRSLLTGATRSHSYANQLLDAAALNEIFTNLGTAFGGATISITGNPGAATCNQALATEKGWTVIN